MSDELLLVFKENYIRATLNQSRGSVQQISVVLRMKFFQLRPQGLLVCRCGEQAGYEVEGHKQNDGFVAPSRRRALSFLYFNTRKRSAKYALWARVGRV